jgi:hypothetical protein
VISHVPVFLALLAIATVNYWMTGSPFGSVYNFGYGDFKSMDFLHPELLAVLVHPWHGLFAYHPLYLIGFASLFVMIRRQHNRTKRLLLVVTAFIIMLHIYLHASWYAWWLGLNTFGMRGLSICVIIVIPVLLTLMSEREKRGESNNVLIVMIFLANIWSFALLTQGETQYYTYQQLFSGIISASDNLISLHFIILPVAVFGLGSLATLIYGKSHSSFSFKNVVTAVLLLLVIQYQITQLFFDRAGMLVVSLMSLVVMFLILMGYRVVIEEFQKHCVVLQRIFLASSVLICIALTVLFANLAVATNHRIAAKMPAPRSFAHISTFNVDEVRLSCMEYMSVPGFDDKKARLIKYLDYLDKGDDKASLLK